MSEIRVKEGESLESALRRFKRSTARSGVLAEVRKREAYGNVIIYYISLVICKEYVDKIVCGKYKDSN